MSLKIISPSKVYLGSATGSGGGGGQTGEYFVKVIDYDGTVLDEQWLDDGAEYTLPSAPSHEGLVFQEWSSSETITDGKITIDKNNVMIGAIYTTVSGLSEFDITLTTVTGLNVTLNMDGTKNWGDGTSDTSTTHTYSSVGDYTITCNGTTMTGSSSSGLFDQSSSTITAIRFANITSISDSAFAGCYSLTNIIIPEGVTSIGEEAFKYCYSLTNIIIPKGVTSIGYEVFYECYSLTNIIIPESVTSIGYEAFFDCYSLKSIIIPEGVTSIGDCAFEYCYSLKSIIIPEGVTSIGDYAFEDCYCITEYDFTKHTSVPILSNTGAFSGINKICKIKVPIALYDQWIAATNWSTYADYIVAV